MTLEFVSKITKTDLLVVPLYSDKKSKNSSSSALKEYDHPDFEAKTNETLLLYRKDPLAPRVLLVGLGDSKTATYETWRQAGGTLTRYLKKPYQSITLLPCEENASKLAAFLEGTLLGHYRFQALIQDEDRKLPPLPALRCVIQDLHVKKALETATPELKALRDAVHLVRDLVSLPSNHLPPRKMSEAAQKIAKKNRHIKCTVYGETKLKKMGMGCLLGVGNGAEEETQFIVLEYKHKPTNKAPIVLIGKGICFDSGGLNLKTHSIEEMKYDMTGAATVLGVFQLLAELKPNLHIVGLLPCAENLPSKNPTKPGDVHRSYDGTTVEVMNTDAEGRLILCDAIGYAVKNLKPKELIDVATLTGAAIIALGYDITALMTNDPALGNRLKLAAEAVDEKVWELPLETEYRKHLKSSIADVTNYSPKASAGTIMGGIFLEHFTKGTPWAHLDMGGSAWTKEDKPYCPSGATGRMVRTLWQYLKSQA